jgi:hypothetical protein
MPENALRRLREQTFAQGQFLDPVAAPEEHLRQLYERAGFAADSSEWREAALELVRMQQAFENGREEDLRALPRHLRRSVRRARELNGPFGPPPRRTGQPPATLDELLERIAECGTHSILDITHLAARRSFGAAIPLPPRVLQRIFGNLQPTRREVQERWDEVAERLKPWQAYYLVVYRGDQPQEYAFVGCSGD